MNGRMYHYLRNKSIFSRVHRINMLIAVIPMLIVAVVSFILFISVSMERLSENESNALYHYTENLSNELHYMDANLTAFTQSAHVQNLLKRHNLATAYEHYLALDAVKEDVLWQYSLPNYITNIILLTNKYEQIDILNGPHGDFRIEGLDYVALLRDTVNRQNKAMLCSTSTYMLDQTIETNQDGFLYAKRIADSGAEINNVGYILLYLDKASFFNFSAVPGTANGGLAERFIFSERGTLFYAANADSAALPAVQIHETDNGQSISFHAPSLSRCVTWPFPVLNGYMVAILPATMFLSSIISFLLLMIALLALLLVISLRFSSEIAQSVSIPVNDIHASLQAIEQNDFSLAPPDPYQDELASVRNLLTHTTRRLSQLLQDAKDNEKQKFLLQFQALQSQMNPHFLINTLNSVAWLADMQGEENIKAITHSLIGMLYEIFNNSDNFGSVADTLEFLNDYVEIQQYRYYDRFTMQADVDPATLSCRIPRFMLQPLIENCIIHGLDDSIPFMTISLLIYLKDDQLCIDVMDDGIGMPPERLEVVQRLEEIRKPAASRSLMSIGLYNINKRIQLMYGDAGSISINSTYGKGTELSIMIPAQMDCTEEEAE